MTIRMRITGDSAVMTRHPGGIGAGPEGAGGQTVTGTGGGGVKHPGTQCEQDSGDLREGGGGEREAVGGHHLHPHRLAHHLLSVEGKVFSQETQLNHYFTVSNLY